MNRDIERVSRFDLRSPLAVVVLLLGLALAILLVRTASAEDPDGTFVTTLRPGDNLVGWTGQAEPVESLFEDVPEVQHVWAWDAAWHRWRFAAPSVPKRMWSLKTLTPGMGLRVRVGGNANVIWERSRRPARGSVELSTGFNLVAWMGRDQVPLARVALGVGRPASVFAVGGSDSSGLSYFEPEAIEDMEHPPQMAFGEALWVEVERDVNWLQPTGVLPTMVFPEHAREPLQEQVRNNLLEVLDFLYEQYGVEPDFNWITVFVPLTFEDWVEMLTPDVPNREERVERKKHDPSLRQFWNMFGGLHSQSRSHTTREVYVRMEYFLSEDWPREHGKNVLLHELVHAIQFQLHSGGFRAPTWAIEGLARYVEHHFRVYNGERSWAEVRSDFDSRLRSLPPLAASLTDRGNPDPWTIGAAAMILLADDTSRNSLVELYRTMAPTGIGLGGAWPSVRTWPASFEETYGISVESFYERFESQRAYPATSSDHHDHEHVPPVVSGTLVWPGSQDTVAIADVRIGCLVGDGTVSLGTSAHVATGGQFELSVQANSECLLHVQLSDPPCHGYWSEGKLVSDHRSAKAMTIGTESPTAVDIAIPEDPCPHLVHGRLVSTDGAGLPGVRIRLPEILAEGSDRWAHSGSNFGIGPETTTGADGSFQLFAPSATRRALAVNLGPFCRGYVDSDQSVDSRRGSRTVSVERGSSPLLITVPNDLCVYRVTGRLLGPDGRGLAEQVLFLSGDNRSVLTQTLLDGSFEVIAPTSGVYRLNLDRPSCKMYYRDSGTTLIRADAEELDVSEDVAGLLFVLPSGYCEPTIRGRLLDVQGRGIGQTQVNASGDGHWTWTFTETDGSFALVVPKGREYRLSARLPSCQVFYRSNEATKTRQDSTPISIGQSPVTGLRFEIPDGLCR